MSKTPIEQVRELRDMQRASCDCEGDDYFRGMFNGLELALACMENREPQYIEAPKRRAVMGMDYGSGDQAVMTEYRYEDGELRLRHYSASDVYRDQSDAMLEAMRRQIVDLVSMLPVPPMIVSQEEAAHIMGQAHADPGHVAGSGAIGQGLGQVASQMPVGAITRGQVPAIVQQHQAQNYHMGDEAQIAKPVDAPWTGIHVDGIEEERKFFEITCPCGVTAKFPLNALPEVTTPHPCGEKDHYTVRYPHKDVSAQDVMDAVRASCGGHRRKED